MQAPPPSPPSDLVVLIADPDSNVLGRAAIQAQGQTVELDTEREVTRIVPGTPPSPPATMPEEEFQERFGSVLAVRVPRGESFVLYFRTGHHRLIGAFQPLLLKAIETIRNQPLAEVIVTGHTDTRGERDRNSRLGLRRAMFVRDRLVAAGIPVARIDTVSSGEVDPLVATPDGVAEPRNRRVEVIVR